MVDTVVIPTSDSGPSLEDQAAAQAAAEEKANETPPLAGETEGETQERPEWLPEKFKTAEDMAKAYAELEKAQSQQTPEGETDSSADEAAEQAVENAGLDMEALSAEWDTNGDLSEDSYKKLEEAGISRDMVEMYARGVQSQTDATLATLLEPVGGSQEAYDEITEWAGEALSDQEIESFNKVLDTGTPEVVQTAVKGLADKYREANGFEPNTELQGQRSTAGNSVYESTADLMKDMSNPEYATNPSFRAKVEAKLARSNIL